MTDKPGKPGPGKPGQRGGVFLVLNSNIIFFSRRQASPPMLYPCLLDSAPQEQGLRSVLHLPARQDPVEQRLTTWVTRTWYLYQQRRRIDEGLFGGPPRDALRDRLLWLVGRLRLRKEGAILSAADVDLPWSRRGLSAAQYAPNYDLIPLSSPQAVNYRMTQELASRLAAQGLPCFVFLTPQNHGLLGPLADNPTYHAFTEAIGQVFTGAGLPYRSYDGLVDESLFQDLDHLRADGNRLLADLLAQDLSPRLAQLLTGADAATDRQPVP